MNSVVLRFGLNIDFNFFNCLTLCSGKEVRIFFSANPIHGKKFILVFFMIYHGLIRTGMF